MRKVLCLIAMATCAVMAMAQYGSGSASSAGDLAKSKAELARCQKAYASTKAAYTKKPKSAPLKKAYVEATVRYGTASMMLPVLDRKIKYRQALNLYREALKLDPTNKEAINNRDMIVSIYKSMGRPVPN